MDKEHISEILLNFIVEESNLEDSNFLNDDTNLFDSGLLDSLLIVSIVALCENRFQCAIDSADMTEENFSSIGSISELIHRSLTRAS
jgi:acyl carrier protein